MESCNRVQVRFNYARVGDKRMRARGEEEGGGGRRESFGEGASTEFPLSFQTSSKPRILSEVSREVLH